MWILHGVLFLCVFAGLLFVILWSNGFPSGKRDTVLVVTAHPDDECMFFAPSLLKLNSLGSKVILLCLSLGDYYGQGAVRREELFKSAAVLGIPGANVIVIHDRELPDNPNVDWDSKLVGKHIMKTVSKHKPNTIITFDDYGVSGHPNHQALCRAVRELKNKSYLSVLFHPRELKNKSYLSGTEGPIDVLLLDSVNLFSKYSSCLGLLLAPLFSRCYLACDLKAYLKGRRAMQQHRSQLVWFRRLYIVLSRYMFVNTFREL